MSDVDTWLTAKKDVPRRTPGMTFFRKQFASGTAVAQNDVIRLFQIPRNWIVVHARLSHGGTLGASATAQLRRGTTALTPATTQGGASTVSTVATAPDEPNTTDDSDYLNILAGGAAWGTSATVTVEAMFEVVQPGREV